MSGLLGSLPGESYVLPHHAVWVTGQHLLMSVCCITNLHWSNELCTFCCQPWACCTCADWLCDVWPSTLMSWVHVRLAVLHWGLRLQIQGGPFSQNLSFPEGYLKQILHAVFHPKVPSRWTPKVIRWYVRHESGRVGRWVIYGWSCKLVCFVAFAGTLVSTHVGRLWD